MSVSVEIIALELAIRFLDDYLSGDTYFRTDYEEQNLIRARNQLKLAKEIEEKNHIMQNYINEYYEKYKNK